MNAHNKPQCTFAPWDRTRTIRVNGAEVVLDNVVAIEPLMSLRVHFADGTFRDLPDSAGRLFAEIVDAAGHGTQSGPAIRVGPAASLKGPTP